jgi:septum formation protein
MFRIILASGSPRRKEIFEQVGLTFEICISNKEEITTKKIPEEIVQELAAIKADDIAAQSEGNTIIIGADTVVVLEHQIMGKPSSKEDAKSMLRILQGRKHQVYTGVTVILKDVKENNHIYNKRITFYEVTNVWIKPMTEEQISQYTDTGEPLDKAGAYAVQGRFAVYIDKIEGDYNNIVGFPISKLYSVLLKERFDILSK